MKPLFNLILVLLLSVSVFAESYDSSEKLPEASTELSEEQQYQAWASKILQSLNRQTGTIKLDNAVATLEVPDNFYFLDSQDAETVLVKVWGNIPDQQVLGLLMPADKTPFDTDSWAVTVEYEGEGYVSDADAGEIDYQDLLQKMQADTREASTQRVEQGYDAIELLGWAATPFYDAAKHKLHWAKEVRFAQSESTTLNYNIRVLGRHGVLVLNFIASMDQISLIESQLDTVLAMADFDQGSSYSDFDPDLDDVATYGLGALIAGKVLAKTGLFAILFVFLKKFGIVILIAAAALLKKLWSKKKPVDAQAS